MGVVKRTSKKAKKGYTWEVNFTYKENGITKRHFKGGFQSKNEALDYETMMKAELKTTGKLMLCNKTVDQVYNEFIELGCESYQENTIQGTKAYYKRHIKEKFKDIPIISIDYQMLQKYFNSLKNNGIETNKHIKATLSRIFIYAIKVGYVKVNPLLYVSIKGIEKHRDNMQVLSYNDFYNLVELLNTQSDFKYHAFAMAIQIGYYTGLRISEVFALEKKDIDFEHDEINVNKKLIYNGLKKEELYVSNKLKSKKSKAIIPLAFNLKKVLLRWFYENPYEMIICDELGYYIQPKNFNNQVKKATKELSIDFHFHMLRHTFATNLVNSDVNLKTAQELMRHSNINTTMSVYTHINNQHKLDTLNTVFSSMCGDFVGKSIS
ncbi:MAG: site-specific integrase [Coprobacillus sp.]|nr:site-specific integrase [Coprobacillus sp.]